MLFTFEISNPPFWKPWHFRTPQGHSVGWLWFALSAYTIPPGMNSFVAQRANPVNLEDGKASIYAAMIFGCLALIALLLVFLLGYQPVAAEAEAPVLPCSYESSGQFVMITDADPELDVTVEQLGAVDAYLRVIYGDDQRDHVMVFVERSEDIALTLVGYSGSYEGLSGAQMARVRWNWNTCAADLASDVKVDVIFIRNDFEGAVLFGLMVHELSHASGTPDGDGSPDDASWWERIGGHAYNASCNSLSGIAVEHCNAIRILLDA